MTDHDLTSQWEVRKIAYSILFLFPFVLGFFQNTIAMLVSKYDPALGKAVLAGKEVYIYSSIILFFTLWFLCSVNQGVIRVSVLGLLACLSVLLIVIYSVFSPSFNILSLRQALIIPVALLFGFVFADKKILHSVSIFLPVALFFVAATAYLERLIIFSEGEQFWQTIGMPEFIALKGFEAWAHGPGGVPGNFYTYDLYEILGRPYRRMVGLFVAEPTLLGQMLILPSIYYLSRKRYFVFGFFFFALLLTFSKSGVVGFIIAAFLYNQFFGKKTIANWTFKFVLGGAILFSMILMFHLAFSETPNSISIRLLNVYQVILRFIENPLGTGIGTAGNFAVIFNLDSEDVGLGESYLGAIVGQIGVFGILLYVSFLIFVFRLKINDSSMFSRAVKVSVISTLVGGIASESAISYVGSAFMFALIPLVLAREGKAIEVSQDKAGML